MSFTFPNGNLISTALSILPFCGSATNQYSISTSSSTYSYQSVSDFVPVSGQSLGEIRLGQQMTMQFDFTFNGRSNNPSANQREQFFRIGFDADNGDSCNGQNSLVCLFVSISIIQQHVIRTSIAHISPFQAHILNFY